MIDGRRIRCYRVLCVLVSVVIPSTDLAAQQEPLISPHQLVRDFGGDQKAIWLFPVRAVHGRDWKPALAAIALTAGLIALDPTVTPPLRRTTIFHGFNQVASSTNTSALIAAVPPSLLVGGLLTHNHHATNTALLAAEAVADSEIVANVMKVIDRRIRPAEIAPNGNFHDTWFRGSASSGSFPSGHTIAAFSVASVVAGRYPQHRWAKWVAYGSAAAIGFSRLTLSAHFPADVFAGGVLGLSISEFAVLRH